MIKKAMVLAAGLGTRLRPLTHHLPKPLVPIANTPLLIHHIKQLSAAGVEEIMINLHHLPEPIERHVGDGSAWGVKIQYSHELPTILGTGGGLSKVRDFFEGVPAFLFVNGDILHDIDWESAISSHQRSGSVATLLVRAHPGDPKVGWVGVDQEGWITRVPDMESSGQTSKRMFTGLHVLTPAIFPYLSTEGTSCVLRTGYRGMLEAGLKVAAHEVGEASWRDIGDPASYFEANMAMLSKGEGSHHESKSASGRVIGSVLIGEDVIIEEGSRVGPNCILGDGVRVGSGCQLQDVVVWAKEEVGAGTELRGGVFFGGQAWSLEALKSSRGL